MPSFSLPPRSLQPLSWFLMLGSFVLTGLSLWHGTSGAPETTAESFLSGFGTLFLVSSLLCTAYSPQGAKSYTPQRKTFLRVGFFLVLILTLVGSIFNLLAHQQKQLKETARRELTGKIANLTRKTTSFDRKVAQLRVKKPTLQELKQLDAELEELRIQARGLSAQLKQMR